MAAAIFSRVTAAQGVTVAVGSAGLLPGDQSPPPELVTAVATRGIDLGGHRSRQVTAELVDGSSLVIGMAREHVREIVSLRPDSWPRTFTLKELASRAAELGPRAGGQGLGEWLDDLQAGRKRVELLGSSPADDVSDPIGGPRSAYEATASEIEQLVSSVVARAWPR
jgi:protein-tyrosine phosphatase